VLYLYLDESGDLGFDFVNTKPTKYFTISILALQSEQNRALNFAIKKTIARKLNPKGKRSRIINELKGTNTTLAIKTYFYELVEDLDFKIYSVTFDKKKILPLLMQNKERVYNHIASRTLEKIDFSQSYSQIDLIVDKSKSTAQIETFNQYIVQQVEARLNIQVPLNIKHANSTQFYGLQAVDIFSWGIFRSFERKDKEWFSVFESKVAFCGEI